MESFDPSHLAQLRSSAGSVGLTRDDALAVLGELERMQTAEIEQQNLWSGAASRAARLEAELAVETALADRLARALLDRPFRGDRRDRMYGSDWGPGHDALDEWEARRGR